MNTRQAIKQAMEKPDRRGVDSKRVINSWTKLSTIVKNESVNCYLQAVKPCHILRTSME